VSDQGSHSKNRTVAAVRRALRSQYHFSTAYSPWTNCTVERACKEVLRAARALLSEFRLRPIQWPAVTQIIQAILNSSPSPEYDNIAPILAFTGFPVDTPLLLRCQISRGAIHGDDLVVRTFARCAQQNRVREA
jgi:hypothetical protein